MPIDSRIGNKVQKSLRREEATGTRVDPFPYIGVVKNNLDPTRSGRIQVYIPDLGGPSDDPNNWRTVGYASPFMGYTSKVQSTKDRPNTTANTFDTGAHSYGMWMASPDIGVEVIVLFVAGDPLRGYWLACVNSNLSHFMIPAIAGTPNVDPTSLSAKDKLTYQPGDIVPVTEFNEYIGGEVTSSTFYNNNKPIHKYQYDILKVQGLEKDPVRGAISSSSQRESPSHVFGISTPGRPVNDPADDANYVTKLNSGTLPPDYFTVKSRKGGHSFVMDDGATLGEDQLIRLRTAKGHQILMHDTDNTLYIAHADGGSWIELTPDGSLNVFASGGFSVRAENTINLFSDTDINIEATGSINMKAGSKFAVESVDTTLLQTSLKVESLGKTEFKSGSLFNVDAAGKMSLKSGGIYALDATGIYNNCSKSVSVDKLGAIQVNKLPDVTKNDSTDNFTSTPELLNTIVTVAPTHEPYFRGQTGVFFKPTSPGIQPQTAYDGAVDATKGVTGPVPNPPTDKDLRNQPPCDCQIGNLSSDQMTAYFAAIGKSESGGVYNKVNSIGYVGKYQFGYPALIDGGYVKSSVRSNAQLQNPNSWTGKNGVSSVQDWLGNSTEQEAAMCAYTKRNYSTMCKIGAVTQDQPPEDVAGMLAVSHLLGPGGAKDFRNGKSSADAYGTTGSAYFQKGKYAVAVLAPQAPAVKAG